MNRRQFFISAAAMALATSASAAQAMTVTIDEVRAVFESRDVDMRREAQKALQGEGYYHGKIDGAWGPGTADAYRQLMASDRYKRNASRWTWAHQAQVIDTVFFLNSDAFP